MIMYIENGDFSHNDMEEVVEWYYLSIKKHIEELANIKKALARNRYKLKDRKTEKLRPLLMVTHLDRRCAEILSWIKNLIEMLETQEAEYSNL